MNELDVTRRAKSYMDALSQGIDPVSGKPVPEDSTLHQERLRRCFQYVSGVLEQVIAASAPRTQALNICGILDKAGIPEQVTYSQEPVMLNDFRKALSAMLTPYGVRSLRSEDLLLWLSTKGLLSIPDSTITPPEITEQGHSLGLTIMAFERADRSSYTRKKWTCFLSEKAQRFVAENLEAFFRWEMQQWDMFLTNATAAPERVCSPKPVKLSELVKSINCLQPPDIFCRLTMHMVSRFLLEEGYLEDGERPAGSNLPGWLPTERGERCLGITLREKEGPYPDYTVYYSPQSQRFIVDHLAQIIDLRLPFSTL